MHLVLASTSPRRRQILSLLGLPFEVFTPDFVEATASHRSIRDEVAEFAAGKAASALARFPKSVIIGSDTMIGIDGQKIGKPADLQEARRILAALSGRRHTIYTSLAMLDGGEPVVSHIETVDVAMRRVGAADIDAYLALNESLDKAGAYSIQGHGETLIEGIEGDFLAAVGLPLKAIARYLRGRGVAFPVDVERLYADRSFLNWRRFGELCGPAD